MRAMEEVHQLLQTYRQEYEDAVEGARQQGNELSQDVQDIAERSQSALQKEEIVDTVSDSRAVETPTRPVVEAMGWAAVMVLGAEIASFFGAYILRPIIGLFFGKMGAGFFAYVGFPLFGLYAINKAERDEVPDQSVRFSLLSLALSQGLLSGYFLSSRFVSAQPLAAVAPCVLAISFPLLYPSFSHNRRQLVLASASAAFLANLVIGFVAGYLTPSFVSLSFIYVGLAAFVLQSMLHRVHEAGARVHIYQLAVLALLLVGKAAFFVTFGARPYVYRSYGYYEYE